jgi:hypothetical protein
MKSRSTATNLTMAAFMFLIVALPCVAQAQSNNHRDTARLLAAPGSGVTLASTWKAVAAEAAPTTASSVTKKAEAVKPLSLASFINAGQFSKSSPSITSQSQMRFEPKAADFKSQFNDLSDTQSKRGRITFVPSSGPWDMK